MTGRRAGVTVGLGLALVCALALTQAPTRLNPYPGGDHPIARADWFMRFRQSRDAISPAVHRYRAYERALRMPVVHPGARRRQFAAAGAATLPVFGSNWTELGPRPESDPNFGNVAGRLTAIAVDLGKDSSGNTVYLGGADGGLWYSTNALSATPTFTPIGDNLPSLAIGSIALDDSTTPTTIYVGTGEPNLSQDSYYGDGIFKSTDGGQTWTTGSGVDFVGSAVSRLLVDPANPQVLLAAMTEGGVYVDDTLTTSVPAIGLVRSADGGTTWTQEFSGASGTDIVYDPADKAFYAAIRAKGFYRSTDDGLTWSPLPTPFTMSAQTFYRASLAVRGTTLFALVTDSKGLPSSSTDCSGCAGLLQSGNEGQSWTALNLPANLYGANNQGTYDQYLAAPPNTAQLIVGGIDIWLGTAGSNNALTWTNLTNSYTGGTVHPDEHAIACVSATQWITANDGGAWSTANAGASWTNMNATLGTIQFYSISAEPGAPGSVLGGSQDNGTALVTSSSTQTWDNKFGGDGGHTAINPSNPAQFFTENYGISLAYSPNSGLGWFPVVTDSTITDHGEFYIPYILAPGDPSSIYLLTQRVWEGPAAPATPGAGWAAISPNLIHPDGNILTSSNDDLTALAAAPNSPNVLYVGAYDGSLSVSTDATNTLAQPTWTEIQQPAVPFAGPVSAIAVSPVSPQTVYWGFGFLGANAELFKSTDGGQTAVSIAGDLPGVPINAIVIDPAAPNNIYVATDVGVFLATDGGTANEQWSRLGSNLPAAAALSLALTRTNDSNPVLIAGTHGRGAWSIPAAAPAGFSFAASPALPVVVPGVDSTQVTLHPTFADGFTGPVTWACTSTAGLKCSFSAATSSPGSGDVTATVTGLASAAASANLPLTVTATSGTTTFSEQFTLANNGDFSLAASPTNLTIANGQKGTIGLNFAVSYGLNLNVAISCSGLPTGYTCQTSSPVAIANGTSATLTLTPAAGAVMAAPPLQRSPGGAMWLWLLAVAALLASGLVLRQRKRLIAGLALLLVATAACGGSTVHEQMIQNTVVTITATDTTAGVAHPLTHSQIVTLTIN